MAPESCHDSSITTVDCSTQSNPDVDVGGSNKKHEKHLRELVKAHSEIEHLGNALLGAHGGSSVLLNAAPSLTRLCPRNVAGSCLTHNCSCSDPAPYVSHLHGDISLVVPY